MPLRILIVDDEAFMRDMLPPVLARGFGPEAPPRIETAATPEEALRIVDASPPGEPLVVLSDFNLRAVRTGLHLLAEVAQMRPDATRILFSGHARDEIGGLDGARLDGFIEKPFRLQEIVPPFLAIVGQASGRRDPAPPFLREAGLASSARALDPEEVATQIAKASSRGEVTRARTLLDEAGRRQGTDAEATRFLAWQNRVLELVATGAPLETTLTTLALAIEAQLPGVRASILLVDECGATLSLGAAPSLPASYRDAMKGLVIGPGAGSCGTAAFERRCVVVADTQTDPRWASWKDVAKEHGLLACWSAPILSQTGKLFGTFALYHGEPKSPGEREFQVIELGANLARVAVESHEDRRAIQRAEARWRVLYDTIPSMYFTLALDGLVLNVNAYGAQQLGYRVDELVGRPVLDVFHEDDKASVGQAVHDHLASGRETSYWEFRKRRKDGSMLWVAETVHRTLDETGRPVLHVVCNDITERKRAEEDREALVARERAALVEARAERERLQLLFLQAPAAIAIVEGPDHVWTFVNGRYEDLVGRTRAQLIGRRVTDVFPEVVEQGFIDILNGVRKTGEPFVANSMPLELGPPHARRLMYLNFIYQPVRGPDGSVTSIMAHAVDVSAQVAAQNEAKELAAALERRVGDRTASLVAANRDLESFNYVVSHDLRAPLRAVQHLVGVALDELPTSAEATRTSLVSAQRSIENMARLIDGLLQLARVTRGEFHHERVDLTAMAETVMQELRVTQPDRDVVFQVQADVHAMGDPRLMRSVMENLLGNAWKFTSTRPQARISFGARTLPNETVYWVKDNGVGFDMSRAKNLFQPFERLHSDAVFDGSGIGLATVRRIIERQGGRVWAEAGQGQGATFHFSLPHRSTAEAEGAAAKTP